MRSNGPFAVYDHSMHKGDQTHLIAGNVNEQARQRFKRDVDSLKKTRESQKQQFYMSLEAKQKLEQFQTDFRKQNNMNN